MSSVYDELSADLLSSFQFDICIPIRKNRNCKNNPDRFSYICGNVVLPDRQVKITDFVKKAYRDYFGVKLGDQDKPFTPHICSKATGKNLRDRRNSKRKKMLFTIPMVWREGRSHYGLLFLHDKSKNYKSQDQAPCPIPRCSFCHKTNPSGPRPSSSEPDGNMEYSSNSEHNDIPVVAGNGAYKPEEDDQPVPLTQAELNNLTRNVNLSKEFAQPLGSRLKKKDLLAPRTTFH